jgi:DNA polymerase III subunit epsilon
LQPYILVIDTEATGLPKNWRKKFTDMANWPRMIQAAWLIYKQDGTVVKQENFYINNNDVDITPASYEIHKLDKPFLKQHGIPRQEVLQRLKDDIETYNPLIVGHFIEFDFLLLSFEYYCNNIQNPLLTLQTFCTMMYSKNIPANDKANGLPLGNLYTLLFNTPLENQHDALVDATATAKCFFYLLQTNAVNDTIIGEQPVYTIHHLLPTTSSATKLGNLYQIFSWFVVFVLILYIVYAQ